MQDVELYRKILGITHPWSVAAVTVDLKASEVRVEVAWTAPEEAPCPGCGKRCPGYDRRPRSWRHLDTCQLRTVLVAEVPRVECAEHGVVAVRVPWAEPGSRFTALFEALAIDWLKLAPMSKVAERLGISWNEAAGVQSRAVKRGMARRRLRPPSAVGVDETSYQKRHEYVTVLSDLKEGHVIDVADDRTKAACTDLLKALPPSHLSAIKAVAMDMSPSYIEAARATLAQAEEAVSFDRFHVAKYLNERVNDVRKSEHRELQKEGDDRLKGARFIFLENPETLDEERFARLEELRTSGLKVARAWALKEAARHLWHYTTRWGAERAWKKWIGWAIRSRLKPMVKAAQMVRKHLSGIVNAVALKVTSAFAESVNAVIQRVKGRACGYRNRARFREAILFHCGGLDLYPIAAKLAHSKP